MIQTLEGSGDAGRPEWADRARRRLPRDLSLPAGQVTEPSGLSWSDRPSKAYSSRSVILILARRPRRSRRGGIASRDRDAERRRFDSLWARSARTAARR